MVGKKPIFDEFEDETFSSPAAALGLGSNNNPLAKYFRIPGLSVTLPTQGAFLPPGGIELTHTGDVPVFPMRAADELLLKSPDALLSGYAIEKLLESCVPAIKTPRLISAPDLDVLLLAIRAATFGETMQINSVCPHCGEENEYDCHLPTLLENVTTIDPENIVRLTDEIVVYVRPYNLDNSTMISLSTFQETKKLQMLEIQKVDDKEKTAQLNQSFERMTKLNMEAMADCIIKVVVPDGTVTDRKNIAEFLQNISRSWVNKIEGKLKEINSRGMDKSLEVECLSCKNSWKTEVEFNPTSFFGAGS